MTDSLIANISRVPDRRWTGGDFDTNDPQVAALQITEAQFHGLTHIVDARKRWDDSWFLNSHAPDLRYR